MRTCLSAAILLLAAGPAFPQVTQSEIEQAIRSTVDTVQALNERREAFRGARELEALEFEEPPTQTTKFPGFPDDQPRWHYLTKPLVGSKAVHAKVQDGWRLNSLGQIKDSAGFFSLRLPYPTGVMSRPKIDRRQGFSLHFRLAVPSERHVGGQRAGISVIVVSDDLKGVEVAFWENEVWAQLDNPLFTHGEGAAFQTNGAADYELKLSGDRYALTASGRKVLEGQLKDYSSFGFPYDRRSFLFYGDDTGSAAADMELKSLRVEYGAASVAVQ